MARPPIFSTSKSHTSKKPGSQRTKEISSRGRQKTRNPYTVRRSARLQAKSWPTLFPLIYEHLQNPSVPTKDLTDAPQTRQRKRVHDPENEHLENERQGKRRRISPPAISERIAGGRVRQPLSEQNLRTHNRLLETYLDDQVSQESYMDEVSNHSVSSEGGRRKRKTTDGEAPRSASQSSTNPVADSVKSQKSTSTAAYYRWSILQRARIYIRGRPPPQEIQRQIDAIVEKASPERKQSLTNIGKDLYDAFAEVLDKAAGEDDCIEILYRALSSMDELKRLELPRKADWRVSLKPRQPPIPDVSFFLSGFDDPTVPVNTQQLTDANYPSPHISGSASIENMRVTGKALHNKDMPPPPPPQAKLRGDQETDRSFVKTPRPDVTVGIRNAVLLQKLQGNNLDIDAAERVLFSLQEQMTYRNGNLEPLLSSEPTTRLLKISFPFLMVEGKSYATGKPVFEAQNQAAVSGACALKILHDLADLADQADRAEGSSGSQTGKAHPLVFSICTEGPSHELWAHYTVVEGGVRKFNMSILKTCHASIRSEVSRFLTAVDNVISWGSGDFLDDVAERLRKVAKRVGL
ncbi:hypothetical protein MMC29_007707 [Sticta canariensis]|nr:hypothetical protein [Sticta canariensis]